MKRSRLLVLGLGAVSALLLVGFVLVQQLTITSATSTPEWMQLTVKSPAPGSCAGEECTLELGQAFTLTVEVLKFPTGGYGTLQSYIDYGSDLTYKPTTDTADEIIWPDLGAGVAFRGPLGVIGDEGFVSHSGITALIPPLPVSEFTGNAVEVAMNCSAGASSTEVLLRGIGDSVAQTLGAGFASPDGSVQTSATDSLTINCGGGAGPTDTPVPTTTGPTATPTEPVVGATPTNTVPPPPPTATLPPPPPTATPPDVILGDVDCNGSVNSLDALWVLWLVAALADELPCPEAGDVNEDGMTDATDALWILWIEADLL